MAGLTACARVLRAGFAARGCQTIRDAAEAAGLDERNLRRVLGGGTAAPTVDTLRPMLSAIRPGDKDGGWGWFGRELNRISG